MHVTNKSWSKQLRIMDIVNTMFSMSMDAPFMFDCAVRFKNEEFDESVTFCACEHEQYGEISSSALDNRIFYYVMSQDEFESVLDGGEDFVVTDIYPNTYEVIHLDGEE